MNRGEISAPINRTTYTENGARFNVVTVSTHQPKTATNNTAVHEAYHIVTAENNNTPVESATIVASGNALGATFLSAPDAAAAMAPHAHGHSGTSWDVYITMRMGASTETASSTARSIVNTYFHQINPVAVALEENRTMSGSQLREVMRKADEEKDLGPAQTVDIFIKSSDGIERKIRREKVRGENVIVVLDEPESKDKDNENKNDKQDHYADSDKESDESSGEVVVFPGTRKNLYVEDDTEMSKAA